MNVAIHQFQIFFLRYLRILSIPHAFIQALNHPVYFQSNLFNRDDDKHRYILRRHRNIKSYPQQKRRKYVSSEELFTESDYFDESNVTETTIESYGHPSGTYSVTDVSYWQSSLESSHKSSSSLTNDILDSSYSILPKISYKSKSNYKTKTRYKSSAHSKASANSSTTSSSSEINAGWDTISSGISNPLLVQY